MKTEAEKQAEAVVRSYCEDSSRQEEMKSLLKAARRVLPNTDEIIIITVDNDGIASTRTNVSDRHLIAALEMIKHKMIHKLFGRGL